MNDVNSLETTEPSASASTSCLSWRVTFFAWSNGSMNLRLYTKWAKKKEVSLSTIPSWES